MIDKRAVTFYCLLLESLVEITPKPLMVRKKNLPFVITDCKMRATQQRAGFLRAMLPFPLHERISNIKTTKLGKSLRKNLSLSG